MAVNGLTRQGFLNRLVAAVTWDNFPELNATAPFLAKEGIRFSLEGDATTYIPTMIGGVPSPEPYQVISVTINLLKTQPLSNLWKQQMELSTLLGNGTVFPDVAAGLGLSRYRIINGAIVSVPEQDYAGNEAAWRVVCKGFYNINAALF